VEGRGRALVDILSRSLHGRTGDNHDGAEIHTGYLPENQFETIPLEPACFAKYACSNERVRMYNMEGLVYFMAAFRDLPEIQITKNIT